GGWGVGREVPDTGRRGGGRTLPPRAGRLGASPPHGLERRAQRAPAPPGLSGQRSGLADLAPHVQRGRGQHDPLERSLPALQALGLPGEDPPPPPPRPPPPPPPPHPAL